MIGKRQVNSWTLTGRRISPVEFSGEEYTFTVETYSGENDPTPIPVRIPEYLWSCAFEDEEYFYFNGSLTSTEIEPHKFKYDFLCEKIAKSTREAVLHTLQHNDLQVVAFLAQDPVVQKDTHPYQATLYLGLASFWDDNNNSFYGDKEYFNATLLRKNTKQIENLKKGDVIQLKSTVTFSEEFGAQIIGKQVRLVRPSPPEIEESVGEYTIEY